MEQRKQGKPLESVDAAVERLKQAHIAAYEGRYQHALSLLWSFAGLSRHGQTVLILQDVKNILDRMAVKLSVGQPTPVRESKIRLGYLTDGFDYTQAPVMNLLNFVRYANYEKFDITVYSRISPYDTKAFKLENYHEGIKRFQEAGAKVSYAAASTSDLDRVKLLYARMLGDNLDILDSYVMYTIPACYLLCAMRPAPIIIKECWQQPEYLEFPNITIHASKATFRQDTGKCELLEWQWPRPGEQHKYTREELGLPVDRPCIATIGRAEKFSSVFFEHLHRAIISCEPYCPVVGVIGSSGESTDTIKYLGVRDNLVDILKVFDFYIDTFPLGGGKALADATFAGLPVVTFDGSAEEFRVEDWTMPEIPNNPTLTIPRWDYLGWEAKVRRLVTDRDFLRENAEYAEKRAVELGDFTGYMRRREEIYERLYNQKIG